MNDDFLYTLRRPPPAEFSRKLQRHLQQQDLRRAKRFSMARTLLTVFLIGGSALAGAYIAMNGRSDEVDEALSPPLAAAVEQSPSSQRARTDASAPPISVYGAAASDDMSGAADPNDSQAGTQLSAAGSSTSSGDLQVGAGAIRDGSTSYVGGGFVQRKAPRVRVVTSALAHSLVQDVANTSSYGSAKSAIDIRIEEAAAAFASLCSRPDEQSSEIVVTDRRMSDAELESCRRLERWFNVVEFKIGYQAIVLASGVAEFPAKLSTRAVQLALAQRIPDPSQAAGVIDNPYRSWEQIDRTLESRPIQVLGPARGTSLRRAFEILVLGSGCARQPTINALQDSDPERYEEICYSLRTDRLYQEVEQTATMVSQQLWAEPHAIAVVDYNFYRAQRSQFAGSALGRVEPTDATLADGTYPLARPVYVYANAEKVRGARVSPGARLYWEFVDRAPGYLSRNGLTPVDEQELKAQYERQQIPTLKGALINRLP